MIGVRLFFQIELSASGPLPPGLVVRRLAVGKCSLNQASCFAKGIVLEASQETRPTSRLGALIGLLAEFLRDGVIVARSFS